VTLERHGAKVLVEKLVKYRLAHPSKPEVACDDLLKALGYCEVECSTADHLEEYERECPVDVDGLLRLDFGSRYWRWAIEVRGGCHDVWDTEAHEASRLETIHAAGWSVLTIRDVDLVNSKGNARYAWGVASQVQEHIQKAIAARFNAVRRGQDALEIPF
jgi:very-short-patch-repair endonuclease